MKRIWAVRVAALVSVAVTAASCGQSSPPQTTTSTAQRAANQNQINPLSRDQIKDGGKFTIPLDSMPANFNYDQLDGTSYDGILVFYAILPWLFRADASAVVHWNKDYLTGDPTVVTEPKQVVTYELNPKAVWTDGTPITWQDYYWEWKATNGTNKAYIISGSQGYEDIESIARGKDDYEVVMTYKNKFAEWKSLFYPLYPASTNKDPKIFNEGWKDQPLVTSGPFKLASLDRTAKTITLVRNDKWWGTPAKLDTLVFRVIDPDSQIDAIANGEIDTYDNASDVNKLNRARSIAGVDIREAAGPNYSHITFNGSGPILSDVTVRRAIAMAIDRGAITRSLLGPLGFPTQTLGNHIYMANQAGYQDNSGEVGTFNPDRAKQLLDQAGWISDGTIRKKAGKPLEISMVIPSGIATSRQVAELVQNMLAQVGAKADVNTVPINDFFDKYVDTGHFDLTFFSWIGLPFPISSSKGIYIKPTIDSNGQIEVRQNYARIGSDQIDQLYNQATSELDPKHATEIANQIDKLIWDEVHSMPIYQRPDIWPTRKGLANFGARGFADIVYEDVGWAK